MSAFHKALQGVYRGPPVTEFGITCATGPDPDGKYRCSTRYSDMDFGPDWTKFAFIKMVQGYGWTWDKDGNWWCPACSEGGAE